MADTSAKPKRYTPKDFERFFRKYAAGHRLRNIERKPGMPSLTQFYSYMKKHAGLRAQYVHATEVRRGLRIPKKAA